MSGVAVIWSLIKSSSPVVAIVPVARITVGIIPLNAVIPAIGIGQISSTRRNTVSMNEQYTLVSERVQVTVMVKKSSQGGTDYPGQVALLGLVRRACPNTRGTVNGVLLDSVLPDSEGPDFEDTPAGIMMRSQDFIVKWRELR